MTCNIAIGHFYIFNIKLCNGNDDDNDDDSDDDDSDYDKKLLSIIETKMVITIG